MLQALAWAFSQKQDNGTTHPIAYASRTLQPHECNYGISELEALGVMWAVKHFLHYIYGHRFTVYMDHEALKSLLNTPQPSGKLARWGMMLQEMELDIQCRHGRTNARTNTCLATRSICRRKIVPRHRHRHCRGPFTASSERGGRLQGDHAEQATT